MVGIYGRTNILLKYIGEVTRNIDLLPSHISKNVIAHVLTSVRRVNRLPGEGSFQELVFENVKYVAFHHYGDGEGDMDELAEPDVSWTAFARLCERADLVRLRNLSEERIIDRSE